MENYDYIYNIFNSGEILDEILIELPHIGAVVIMMNSMITFLNHTVSSRNLIDVELVMMGNDWRNRFMTERERRQKLKNMPVEPEVVKFN
jgi:hypothetical protein